MAEKISKIVIEQGGKEYEFVGGGGSQPAPDSVGSAQIEDNSVMMDDLNDEVKQKLTQAYDENSGTLYINGARPSNG